jgi:hypothetical protein
MNEIAGLIEGGEERFYRFRIRIVLPPSTDTR